MSNWTTRISVFLFFVTIGISTIGQEEYKPIISTYLDDNCADYHLNKSDVSSFVITDNYFTKHNQVRQIHIMQTRNDLRILNGTANITINGNGDVVQVANRLIPNLPMSNKLNSEPGISPSEAIISACNELNIDHSEFQSTLIEEDGSNFVFEKSSLAHENIPVELVYWAAKENEIKLAWSIKIDAKDGANWWHIILDASSGKTIAKFDRVIKCDHGDATFRKSEVHNHSFSEAPVPSPSAPPLIFNESYQVFQLPVESPNHGSRSIATSPADTIASPFGWLDTNGIAGAEFSITRGNNAYAYEDHADLDVPGYSPNGGINHEFIFPLDLSVSPLLNQDAVITNLFYVNNRVHDISYRFGFDEQAGNFQVNNYGNGGLGGDEVQAEAQDGGGTNNANFATPEDGYQPRMQMYLWTGSNQDSLIINSPSTISGVYFSAAAAFGSSIPTSGITSDIVLVNDSTMPDPNDACEPIVNSAAISGKIAILRRGSCNFVVKVEAAQNAGAIAVVVVNNVAGSPMAMGGTSTTITIPSVMVSQTDGEMMISALQSGEGVNITLVGSNYVDLDGDFDNGVVVHEYTHGISTRLVGGPSNVDCLYNEEQMGEGWSDWVACMLTINLNLANPVHRPMGTYANGEPITGIGIRNAPYDTSFAVNDYTYADVSDVINISSPHGIGFVWATMLWDLTWAFMDEYGVDGNLENGIGGDDIVFQLVLDGMKLAPCSPGFVDARDAILLADELNNNGVNKCMIWRVFAKRGLGFSASQGSSTSRSDQVEAYDVPTICQIALVAPSAGFEANETQTCTGKINFTDLSYDIPQYWHWDFGDGQSDTTQHPFHQYLNQGIYTVTLIVTNNIGSDTLTFPNFINFTTPDNPIAPDVSGCISDSFLLTANASGTISWLDNQYTPLASGPEYQAGTLGASTNFYVVNMFGSPSEQIGPPDENFGTGGYHGSSFIGTVDFTAYQEVTIRSAYVNAETAGVRIIKLWDNFGGAGNILQEVTVNMPVSGPQYIELDFEVPQAGNYSIGLDNAGLYRNNSGASYPYEVAGLLSIVGSPAGPDFYYYFYDLEVEPVTCYSDTVLVQAIIGTVDFSYQTTNEVVQFTDLSSNATIWNWSFGDGNTSTLQNPIHAYSQTGAYQVTLQTDVGTCDAEYQVTISLIGMDELSNSFGCKLQPNPAKGSSTLLLNEALKDDLNLILLFSDGRIIKELTLPAGQKDQTISLEDFSAGIYYIRSVNQYPGIVLKLVVY
ncbi:MAG: T9SS-dependent M36 family metallopeptidase [Bacteroidales bacterium]|nr:T9SS-dependent M36 family metallopeptidase [Bacteroidales bacterium]MCF8458460.1 T9SS-dependent M36 family metallopeptidase [Bacteroidales bacterium]